MQPLRVWVPASLDFTYPPPVDFRRIAVLLVAGHNTTLAANAFGHVEVKAVLLAGQKTSLGDARRLESQGCCALRCPACLPYDLRGQQEVGTLFFHSL
jgi:hypothetical protein